MIYCFNIVVGQNSRYHDDNADATISPKIQAFAGTAGSQGQRKRPTQSFPPASNVSSRPNQGDTVSVPVVGAAGAIEAGRTKKRNNALVAILCGVLPAAILSVYFPTHGIRWVLGFTVGLIWGNAFEYAYHRWLLHRPRSIFAKGHLEHHRTTGGPDQAEHINFGRNAWNVVALFVSNGIVLLCLEALLHLRIAPGVLLGWTIYLILLEEIHWRFHMEEWVPPALRSARSYHLSHHDIPNTRYNVFLPLFDFLFGNAKVALPKPSLQATPRSRAR